MNSSVLYHIPFASGLGADRWIYEGFRSAFQKLGHKVSTFENHENLDRKIAVASPRIFMTSQNDLLLLSGDALSVIRKFRRNGGRVFVRVGEDFAADKKRRDLLTEKGWCDFFFSSYSDSVMQGFEEVSGRPYIFIPFAANCTTHFPVESSPDFECDIAFVGGNLPRKREVFRRFLFPLFLRYRVLVFGPGWSMTDRLLLVGTKIARRMKLIALARFLGDRRITLPSDKERLLYSSTKISLNIHEYDEFGKTLGLSNEREFKIPAAGGFELSDYCPGIERLFVPNEEIVVARSEAEWFRKIDYYLRHDEERRRIQKAGIARALRDHTYLRRAEQIIALCQSS